MIETTLVNVAAAEQPAAIKKVAHPFNRTAMKRHAMKVSIETRNGKFRRVSTEFLDNMDVLIEAQLRALRRDVPTVDDKQVEVTDNFLTAVSKKKICDAFNTWLGREMHRQIKNIRVGRTL